MNLDELLAHVEIQQVLFRYCRGVDRGDRDLIKSVYHAGATDDHGSYQGSGEDFADFIVESMDRSSIVAQHHITNSLIEVHGNNANVESYFIAFHPSTLKGSREESLAMVGGRYLDRFEKRQGHWKIVDRKVVLDFTREPTPATPWRTQDAFALGARREQDPSHQLFATK